MPRKDIMEELYWLVSVPEDNTLEIIAKIREVIEVSPSEARTMVLCVRQGVHELLGVMGEDKVKEFEELGCTLMVHRL